jgi:hypothetical protein
LKAVAFEAAILEPLAGTAGARVFPPQLFDQLFVAMDKTVPTFDGGFTVESPSGACSSIQKLKS